jgi:hypothetical protein
MGPSLPIVAVYRDLLEWKDARNVLSVAFVVGMSVDTTLSGAFDSPLLADDVVRVEHPAGLPGRITAEDVVIKDLGKCRLPSPVAAHLDARALHFVGKADKDVDVVLIPEVPSALQGPHGVFRCLERVIERQGHAVVVVAEGAAQELIAEDQQRERTDKTGNVRLKDVGVFLRDRITQHFAQRGREVTLKYIDPSYAIRSVPASPSDSVYCWNMARNAVHAAMAGNTEMLIGRWHGRFVHVPMPLATRMRKQVDPTDDLWMSVIEATGQPKSFV